MNTAVEVSHLVKLVLLTGGIAFALAVASTGGVAQSARPVEVSSAQLQSMCTAEAAQQVASTLAGTKMTVKAVRDGPFKTATSFVAASGEMPAFCQLTGSFVTNPATGKTANFLATF